MECLPPPLDRRAALTFTAIRSYPDEAGLVGVTRDALALSQL